MADVITRLRIESGEYDSKIKRATQGLLQMEQECRKVGGTLSTLEKDQKEFVRSLGQMQTVSQSARGKVAELSAAYTELRVQYNRLTDAEKKGDFGKALSSSLSQLKTRITEGKNELDSISRELGNVKASSLDAKSVIQELGSRFGVSSDLLSSLTTGTVAYTAAIGAAATAVAAATKQWADYNAELARQDQVTTVTTGLKGDDAERMTSSMRALSRTYDVDFRDAVNAANTLMTQFGKSGDEAIQLLRDGMQGMIQGDGPKMLSMIQQYAPAFRDAGVSASQLIAVIQNSEGGIFTDQNMNAIVMGIKNIRLMTKATSDALAQLGIDGKNMSKQLSDGSLTIFDALKQVATAIQGVDSNSKAAGEVMQQVFGRQGAMAGTKLGEAIASLNTDLEQTKKQTGEVGESFVKLQQANERLEVAIRECFGYDGYQQLAQGIKTQLVTALASTLELTMKIKDSWAGDVAGGFFEKMTDAALRLMGPLGGVLATLKEIAGIGGNGGGTTPSNPEVDKMLKYIGEGGTRQERQRRYGQQINSINRQIDSLGQEKTRIEPDGSTSFYKLSPADQQKYRAALERQKADLQRRATSAIIGSQPGMAASPITPITPIKTGGKGGKDTKTEQTELQKNQTKINALTQEYVKLGDESTDAVRERQAEIQKEIALLQQRNGLLGLRAEQAQGRLTLGAGDFQRDGLSNTPGTLLKAPDTAIPKGGLQLDDKAMKAVQKNIDDNLPKDVKKDSPMDGTKKMLNAISQLTNGLQQIGIELPAEIQGVISVIQGVTSVIEAVNTIIGITQASELTANTVAMGLLTEALWANTATSWIPFANGGVVPAFANGGVIDSGHSPAFLSFSKAMPKFTTGGTIPHANSGYFVGGTHFSGDVTPIMANAGELVLNKAQQGNLASQLQGSGMQNLNLTATIKGEQIRLALNNNGRRTGRGEYVQSSNRA